ncbi:hypothetical protein EDD18DRAFT_1370527 [Armillaria luteobubalina]|uniref:F-box domain-containing protein n=1 Tax=Armillaria luteobubalina TaxID=153913 RepID=A0AA39UB07_9AGAR|nr:hypothetical protein EDD18DRAFT_1370527 [Armillaria luteobubalina]
MDSAEFIVSRHEWNESIVRTGPLPIPDISELPVTSGIHRLSGEDLLRTFHISTQADFEYRLRRDVSSEISHTIPIIISHVCRRWRSLSISSPSLWTTIVIDDCTPLYSNSPTHTHLFPVVDYFISLSRLQPLKVAILLSGIPQQPSSFRKLQAERLGALLFYNANRVTSLTIRGMNWVHQYKILKKLSGKHMPILATFNCDHGSGQNVTPPVYYIPNSADHHFLPILTSHHPDFTLRPSPSSHFPLLQDVCLISTPIVWDHFDAVNLTTLVLAFLPDLPGVHDFRPTYACIHRVLHSSRHTLRSLTLAGILICQQTIGEAKDRLRHPFPMPKLEDLHVGYEDPMEVRNLIIGIAFPELKRLDLVSLDRTEEQGVSIIHMFLALVQALPLQQLISLKLHGVLLPVSLTEMPSISHEGHDDAGEFATQMEDNFTGEGSEGDDDEHEEEAKPYELPFHLSVSDGRKVFDESMRSELTVVFFQSLKALRTLDVSEPDRATLGFLHEAMPDSRRPPLPRLTAIRIAFLDDDFSNAVSTFLTTRAAKLDSEGDNGPPLLTKMIINGPQLSISNISGLISSLTNSRLGVHTLAIEENVQSPENGQRGSLSSSLLPGFHDAISAANHSRRYGSQDHRSVYNLLLDIGRRADENEEMLSSLLPRLHGSIEWLETEVSVSQGNPGFVDHPTLHIQQIAPPPPVAKPFAFLLTYFIEPLESLWRKDDFLWGGELIPDTISPTMLVALANWEALLMETRLVLANLERLVDKMVGDLDVAIGLRRAAVHIEKNIQLSRRSSAPLDSRLKLMALASETGLLEVVASFNVRSPQHLTHVIKIMRILVQEMERVPRRATSAWMVSTEEEISGLKKTIDKVNSVIFGPLGNFAMVDK